MLDKHSMPRIANLMQDWKKRDNSCDGLMPYMPGSNLIWVME